MTNEFEIVNEELKKVKDYYEQLRICGDFRTHFLEERINLVSLYEEMVNQASPKLVEIFYLIYVNGMTQTAISDLMHKSKRAVTALHKQLKDYFVSQKKKYR